MDRPWYDNINSEAGVEEAKARLRRYIADDLGFPDRADEIMNDILNLLELW